MTKYSINTFFSPNHHPHFAKDVISRLVLSGGLGKWTSMFRATNVTQEEVQAAFYRSGMWCILTLQNVSLEKLDPAHRNSAFVEGQCTPAGRHFVGLAPCPEIIVPWVSLVTSTLAPGRRRLAGGAWGPGFFLFAFKFILREYSRCWLRPLYYHISPQAAWVFNRHIVVA